MTNFRINLTAIAYIVAAATLLIQQISSTAGAVPGVDEKLRKAAKDAAGIYVDNRDEDKFGKTIVVTACNYGYLNHLHNIKCYFDMHGMKVLVFAFDEKTYSHITSSFTKTTVGGRYINYFWGQGEKVGEESSNFRSNNFNLIANRKLESVLALMELGYDVLFTDVDIAIPRDPIPYIFWSGVDYVHSLNKVCSPAKGWDFFKDEDEGNTGFYFVRSNEKTIKLWKAVIETVPKYPKLDDQTIFWKYIRSPDVKDPPRRPLAKCQHINNASEVSTGGGRELVSCYLDECLFTSGALMGGVEWGWMQDEMRKRKEERGCVIVHANNIVGNPKKTKNMEGRGYWLAQKGTGADAGVVMGKSAQQKGDGAMGKFEDGKCKKYVVPT